MSHYKPYPAYKDSGAPWLGAVPEHWEVHPMKWSIERNDGGVWGDDPEGQNDTLVLRSTEQTADGNWRIDDPAYRKLSQSDREFALLKDGDLLVTKSSGSSLHIGKTSLVTTEIEAMKCCYSNFMQRIRVKQNLLPKLAWFFMNNDLTRSQFVYLSSTTTGLANLNGSMIGSLLIAIPPVDEQQTILERLDGETARIDALITKKTRFIELLREKRQALITHAVTKGLDPNVKMKDSGVEWLGEVPEHWGIQPLKQLARLDGGAGFPDDEQGIQDAPIPFFKVADLSNGMTSAENYITPETADKLRAKIFPAGTIAFAKVGAALLLNRRVLMPIPGCADNNMMVAIPHGILGTWLHAVLSCYDMAWLVNPGAVPSVNQEQVGNIKIPVPSVEEQRSIVASVSSGTMRIDRIVGKTERSIELLKERRTALITAAVTGQIDLRELSA